MKILKAKSSMPNTKIFPINNLGMLSKPPKFTYQKICESLPVSGMKWPIMICSYENYWKKDTLWKDIDTDKMGVVNGNQRVLWAKENNYTHIEALEVKTRDERDTINKITFISQDEYPL